MKHRMIKLTDSDGPCMLISVDIIDTVTDDPHGSTLHLNSKAGTWTVTVQESIDEVALLIGEPPELYREHFEVLSKAMELTRDFAENKTTHCFEDLIPRIQRVMERLY